MKTMAALFCCGAMLGGCAGAGPDPIPPAPEDAGSAWDAGEEVSTCVSCSLCLFEDGGPDCHAVCALCPPVTCTPCALCLIDEAGTSIGMCDFANQCAVNAHGCFGEP